MADQFGNHNGGGAGVRAGRATSTSRPATAAAAATRSTPAGTSTRCSPRSCASTSTPDPGSGRAATTIPADNPFVGPDGARPEIWLTGLRNPWRIRFDRATGDLWIGDVGQGACEEIDVARAGVGGLDFGWNVMEGTACFRDRGTTARPTGLTLPVTEYGHDWAAR